LIEPRSRYRVETIHELSLSLQDRETIRELSLPDSEIALQKRRAIRESPLQEKMKIIQQIFNAFQYALKGLHATVTHQFAFQIEVALSVVLLPLAYYWGENGIERALLMMSWLLVLVVELINSSIETTVDRIGLEHHKLSGRAKDIASAAVLLSLVNAAAVWFFILADHDIPASWLKFW